MLGLRCMFIATGSPFRNSRIHLGEAALANKVNWNDEKENGGITGKKRREDLLILRPDYDLDCENS